MVRTMPRIEAGLPYPLGASHDGSGVNFAIFSANATKVELCLFEEGEATESHRIALPEYTNEVWHGHVAGLRPGQLYGYRVHGPYAPQEGHRFNANKLLLDPYARSLQGRIIWDDALYGHIVGSEEADLSFDERDSAPFMPRCMVVEAAARRRYSFPWRREVRPNTPWTETVIYEAHVKGMTIRHPNVPKSARGGFVGLAHPAVIDHLARLGVTAVELLPVQSYVDDRFLEEKGLTNYWGYNTLGFFAPSWKYLPAGGDIHQFKLMVHRLHQAGIEVILDVVYNHTGEGNHLGPTLSFRGIDNASYYKLADDRRMYFDTTGCGNTVNQSHPRVLQMILDSLRYWVEECHVDGFRFDLATSLGREERGFDAGAAFFDAIGQDPLLSQVKLIAEPWDVGEGGFQLGNFPAGWAEWNGRFRDDLRSFWKGDEGFLPGVASAMLGSASLFDKKGRRPWSSVNIITTHDGFTLADLYAYNVKHNEANREDNRDGNDDNRSWNCGVEGPTDDPAIRAQRVRMRRGLMAAMLFSQGTPMLLMGDEIGRSQQGNNNSYCHDDPISWFDWQIPDEEAAFYAFTAGLLRLRRRLPLLRHPEFLHGETTLKDGTRNVTWLRPDGMEMQEGDWTNGFSRSLGLMLAQNGHAPLLILLNAYHEDLEYRTPQPKVIMEWRLAADSARGLIEPEEPAIGHGAVIKLPARSVLLFEGRLA
ncbi:MULTISPECIES: glycogen debranching protein GlgX [Rhodomicrobium]|uniref:glycogen debranching protein GlgX n=1 Tax=Rhodomicrobium TaxID=1068 RepID=UPI000B4ACF9F|nr:MULTISPECIES: glycogen debranching protein GlgX [Rhodomicrobium]